MDSKRTTMIDIYEAAGWDINTSRTQVTNDTQRMKPFKIEILVVPRSVTSQFAQEDIVEFDVLMDDTHFFEESPLGATVHVTQHLGTLEMPVSQVKIVKDDG